MNALAAPIQSVTPVADVPNLPGPLTFHQMAENLLQAAQQEAMGLDALHLWSLREPGSVGLNTIADVQRRCAEYYEMSEFLRAAAPLEPIIRAMIAASAGRAAA